MRTLTLGRKSRELEIELNKAYRLLHMLKDGRLTTQDKLTLVASERDTLKKRLEETQDECNRYYKSEKHYAAEVQRLQNQLDKDERPSNPITGETWASMETKVARLNRQLDEERKRADALETELQHISLRAAILLEEHKIKKTDNNNRTDQGVRLPHGTD